MLSATDFNTKGTISEVRVHAGPCLDTLDACSLPNPDSPRSSRNRLFHGKTEKEMCKKDFRKRKPELLRISVSGFHRNVFDYAFDDACVNVLLRQAKARKLHSDMFSKKVNIT